MKIDIEVIDGAVKTTLSKIIAEKYDLKYIKFPRYDFIPIIKKHLGGEIELNDKTTTLLFLADIIDGTNKLNNYVADRLFFSTLAYSKLDLGFLLDLVNKLNLDFPDYVIYIKIDIPTAISRISKKIDISKYDKDLNLLNRVMERYEEIFNSDLINLKTKIIKIDGTKDIESIMLEIKKLIKL